MKKPIPPADLWSQLDSLIGAPPKDDEGFTRIEFAERYRISGSTAKERLNKLVNSGVLIQGTRKMKDGRWVPVYRPK